MEATVKRVVPCFECVYCLTHPAPNLIFEYSRAAALATGCEIKMSLNQYPVFDLRQNKALGTFSSDPRREYEVNRPFAKF